mmetsp:Transcript_18708/g.66640  ORF Transcript_18708/g.66640 Transcript_18708/m.66640 type:complete len:293 (+) Transcript_18708:3669-4547(+)
MRRGAASKPRAGPRLRATAARAGTTLRAIKPTPPLFCPWPVSEGVSLRRAPSALRTGREACARSAPPSKNPPSSLRRPRACAGPCAAPTSRRGNQSTILNRRRLGPCPGRPRLRTAPPQSSRSTRGAGSTAAPLPTRNRRGARRRRLQSFRRRTTPLKQGGRTPGSPRKQRAPPNRAGRRARSARCPARLALERGPLLTPSTSLRTLRGLRPLFQESRCRRQPPTGRLPTCAAPRKPGRGGRPRRPRRGVSRRLVGRGRRRASRPPPAGQSPPNRRRRRRVGKTSRAPRARR